MIDVFKTPRRRNFVRVPGSRQTPSKPLLENTIKRHLPVDVVPLDSDHETFTRFLQKTPLKDIADVDNLLQKYEDYCDSRVDESVLWEKERNTWLLTKMLLETRLSEPEQIPPPHNFSSTGYTLDYLIQSVPVLSEHFIVKEWLQITASPFKPCDPKSDLGRATYKKHGGKYHPDMRDLAQEDSIYRSQLHKTVYEYLRRGSAEKAQALCENNNERWRAASLMGHLVFRDPLVDKTGNKNDKTVGNINHELFARICMEIAKDSSLDTFERATYAVLAGDLNNILTVCETWEDYVWAHYVAMLDSKNLLSESPQISAFEIFETLSKNEKDHIGNALSDRFRFIQTMIILDLFEKLYSDLVKEVQNLNGQELAEFAGPLRFVSHLILVFRAVDYPYQGDTRVIREAENILLSSYARLLNAARKNDIIAYYAAQLPHQMSLESYASFLATINDPIESRVKCLNLAQENGLDTLMIAFRTVQIIFDSQEFSSSDKTVFPGETVSKEDENMIRSLEWLICLRAYEDALYFLNLLVKRFLGMGHLHSIHVLFTTLPDDFITPEMTNILQSEKFSTERDSIIAKSLKEYLGYQLFMECIINYMNWKTVYHSPKPDSLRDYRGWVKEVKNHTDAFGSKAEMFLKNYDDCMFERSLRQKYLTEIVFWMYTVYVSTKDTIEGNLKKALDLVNLVAEDDVLMIDFKKSGRLEDFLQMIKEAYVMSL